MLPETHMSWTWMSCSENIRALATIRRWFGQRCWWKNAAWSHALCQYRWEHFKCWEAPATPMKTTPTRKEGLVWPYWWRVVGRVMIVDFSFQLPLLFFKVNAPRLAFRGGPFGGAWNVVLEGMGKHPPDQKIPKRMQAADFLLHPTSQESGKCIELLVSFALEGFGNFHEDFW